MQVLQRIGTAELTCEYQTTAVRSRCASEQGFNASAAFLYRTECDSRLQRFTDDGKLLSVHEHCLAEHSGGVLECPNQRKTILRESGEPHFMTSKLIQSNAILGDEICATMEKPRESGFTV